MDKWAVSLLGDNEVGKTSLVLQVGTKHFIQLYDATIEDYYGKQFNVDDRMCLVEVIDPAMQEEWRFQDSWVLRGQAALLVYSIASRATFDILEPFRRIVKCIKGEDGILILVGNKCDLEVRREVSQEEGVVLARQLERAVAILVRTLREQADSVAPGETKSKRTKSKRHTIL
ncbi:ras family-domain-containing protein [Mycena galopus ATCC 62051]|nr:ras family-domain-containing protein [Mycena galopus ATCC 62051]